MKFLKLSFLTILFSVSSMSMANVVFQQGAAGGFAMPAGSLAAVNPGAGGYVAPQGPGEQPAYVQTSPGVNCVPRGYSSQIEGRVANGAQVIVPAGVGNVHGQ